MKSYSGISAVSLLSGWFAGIITHGILSFFIYGSAEGGATGMVGFWSFWFVLLAYGLFIRLPKQFILNMFWRFQQWQFLLFTSLYAVLSFTLLIGWVFFKGGSFLIVFADAAVVGLFFGWSFWHLGNKKNIHHTPFDL